MHKNEDLTLNNGYLDFGWDHITADKKDISEFLQSPEGEGFNEEQCNNLEANDVTLLCFLEWLNRTQGFLAIVIHGIDDEPVSWADYRL